MTDSNKPPHTAKENKAQDPSDLPKGVDPNLQQESEKYDNPVPSRDYILNMFESVDRPMTYQEITVYFHINDEDQLEGMRRRLIAMCRDGQLFEDRKSQFYPVAKTTLFKGRVVGQKDGSGTVVTNEHTYYLSNRQMRQVFDGDLVSVRPMGATRKDLPEAVIAEVLERKTSSLVGRFYEQAGMSYITPSNKRITQDVLIPPMNTEGAKHGDFVMVEITQPPALNQLALGRVSKVLGDLLTPGVEIDVALRSHNIPFEWSEDVDKQTAALADTVADEDKLDRVDLRALPFVTIDGEDAKDFDDAVYATWDEAEKLFTLYVAIADVSHYVQINTPLDDEARNRGTSVYFPEYVVPMLPEKLSNGLCSLKPNVDRLAMVSEMKIDRKGQLQSYCFYEAVIHSHARLTYTKVGALFDEPESAYAQELLTQLPEVTPHLYTLFELYQSLRAARHLRGAIDFETTETKIVFDENRKIQEVVPVVRNDAHKIIEECMLIANVATATFLSSLEVDALYRVHEGPSLSRLENLKEFLNELGLSLEGGEEPTPQHYQNLLEQIAERPDAQIIQTLMLRSMQQAVYQPDNLGHFGLNYQAYTHFTSPIRRYPDLLVHRAIRSVIQSDRNTDKVRRISNTKQTPKKEIYPYKMPALVELGEHTSMCERRADDATREVMDFLKCEFMSNHIGETYPGTISTVTSFGLFVQINEFYIEGLIHISNLDGDYYVFDEVHHRLTGERSGRQFRIGDELEIQVAKVDLDDRKIDFQLLGTKAHASRRNKRKSARMPKPDQSAGSVSRTPRKRPAKTAVVIDDDSGSNEKASGKKATKGAKKKKLSKRQKLNNTKKKTAKKSSKKVKKKK